MIDLSKLDKFYVDDFVKDIFIGFMQQLLYQNPGEFHYDPDEEVSNIRICDQFSTDTLTPDFKPTIYIRRRPMGFLNTSIDQFVSGNRMKGTSVHSDLISGVAELVAVSRVGLEACRLGGLIFILITEFRSELRKLGMHDVAVKSLGEEEPKDLRSDMRIVEVPVAVQYTFQYTWMKSIMNATVMNAIDFGRSTGLASGAPLVKYNPNAGMKTGDGLTLDENGNVIVDNPCRTPGNPDSPCADNPDNNDGCRGCSGDGEIHTCIPLTK